MKLEKGEIKVAFSKSAIINILIYFPLIFKQILCFTVENIIYIQFSISEKFTYVKYLIVL